MVGPSLSGPGQRDPPCPELRGVHHAETELRKKISNVGQILGNGVYPLGKVLL